jgi:hypothetical protein
MKIKKHSYRFSPLEITNLVLSFGIFCFYMLIMTWWPLVSNIVGISLLFLILTILGFLFSLYLLKSNKFDFQNKLLLYIARILWFVESLFLLMTILMLMLTAEMLPQRYEQLAQVETAGKKYLLVYYSGGCTDCGHSLTVYRCELFNLICPPFGEGLHNADALPYTLSKLTIEVSPDQKRVNMLEDGKVVHVFSP